MHTYMHLSCLPSRHRPSIHTSIHSSNMHTYIHTQTRHACIVHASIHLSIHTYMHTCKHECIRACTMHTCTYASGTSNTAQQLQLQLLHVITAGSWTLNWTGMSLCVCVHVYALVSTMHVCSPSATTSSSSPASSHPDPVYPTRD